MQYGTADPDPKCSLTLNDQSVLVQYGLPVVGPSVKLNADGITLSAGAPGTGSTSITLHPTNGITLRFGEWSLMINQQGITMLVGKNLLKLMPTGFTGSFLNYALLADEITMS